MAEQQLLILLVDDDKEFREIFSIKLRASGFKIVEAANGEEGIRKAKEVKPDLMLLDLIMPVMNGAEALLKIQSDKDLAGLKVAFLTNYGEPKKELEEIDKKFAKEASTLGYIMKTNNFDSIVEEIKNIIRAPAPVNPNN